MSLSRVSMHIRNSVGLRMFSRSGSLNGKHVNLEVKQGGVAVVRLNSPNAKVRTYPIG